MNAEREFLKDHGVGTGINRMGCEAIGRPGLDPRPMQLSDDFFATLEGDDEYIERGDPGLDGLAIKEFQLGTTEETGKEEMDAFVQACLEEEKIAEFKNNGGGKLVETLASHLADILEREEVLEVLNEVIDNLPPLCKRGSQRPSCAERNSRPHDGMRGLRQNFFPFNRRIRILQKKGSQHAQKMQILPRN